MTTQWLSDATEHVTEGPEPTAATALIAEDPADAGAKPAATTASGSRWYQVAKRAIDVFVVVGLAPLWVPMYGAVFVAIAVFDGRPIYYRHPRVGRKGRSLRLLKFRTMQVNANRDLQALLEEQPALKAEFLRFAKLRSDPRLTRIGRFLRRMSLDELPQLLQVLRGEMSLVGPRPLTRWEIERFYGDSAEELLSVPPGLTGLWQISGRSELSVEDRVPLDLKYVRERTIRLDLGILVRTLPFVIRGHGAV